MKLKELHDKVNAIKEGKNPTEIAQLKYSKSLERRVQDLEIRQDKLESIIVKLRRNIVQIFRTTNRVLANNRINDLEKDNQTTKPVRSNENIT